MSSAKALVFLAIAFGVSTISVEGLIRRSRSPMPLVIPPPLPYASEQRSLFYERDLPLPEDKDFRYDGQFRYNRHLPSSSPSVFQLTPNLVKTCTPDCTAPHCTTECKCANTHAKVHAMCNPPPSSDYVGICQAWYAKCPMYEPVHY